MSDKISQSIISSRKQTYLCAHDAQTFSRPTPADAPVITTPSAAHSFRLKGALTSILSALRPVAIPERRTRSAW